MYCILHISYTHIITNVKDGFWWIWVQGLGLDPLLNHQPVGCAKPPNIQNCLLANKQHQAAQDTLPCKLRQMWKAHLADHFPRYPLVIKDGNRKSPN